jgi:hypothetical protein
MTTHLGALAVIALSLAVLTMLALIVQSLAGNSGWLRPVRSVRLGSHISMFFPPPPEEIVAGDAVP